MDEREAAWRELHEPGTDAATLAQIAADFPEFAEKIAAHPNCYAELRVWATAAASSAPSAPPDPETGRRAVWFSGQRRIVALATVGAVVIAGVAWGLIAAAGGSRGEAALATGTTTVSPTPRKTTPSPTPSPTRTPTPIVTSTDLAMEPLATGAAIVIEPIEEYDQSHVTLYSPQAPAGVGVSVAVRANEKLRDVTWAVESDSGAPPTAVAIVFISTEASGLTGTPDRLELRTFDATGALQSTVPAEGLTGISAGFEGWFRDSAADAAAVVDGTLLISTRSLENQWIVAGLSTATGARSWTIPAEDDVDNGFAVAPEQKLALFTRRNTLYAIDPATGHVTWQTDGAEGSIETFDASPFFHANLARASVGTLPGDFRDTATGTAFAVPPDYRSWAVDEITGRLALTWSSDWDGDYPDSGPGFLVLNTDGSTVFTLTADEARNVGKIEILGAYDNRIWIQNSSGVDIIDSATGQRDPIVTTTDEPVLWMPAGGNRVWTLLSTGDSSSAAYRLVLHPGGPVPLAQLSLFSQR